MHIIKFGQVNSSPAYKGRVANRSKLQKYLDLGYEIIQVPVMVDNRGSWNQEAPPEEKDLDYLLEISAKTYKKGQQTKQLKNDLLTYDVTGSIGKDLYSFLKPKLKKERRDTLEDTSFYQFFKYKLTKSIR